MDWELRKDFEFSIVRPGYVRYEDHCEHQGVGLEEFFDPTKTKLKTFTVFGLVSADEDFVRVLFYLDESDNEECQGIVIPSTSVLEVVWLDPVPESREIIPVTVTKPSSDGGDKPN